MVSEAVAVHQSLIELKDLTSCRCNEAFKSRGLQDPDCNCDYRQDVDTIEEYVEKTFRMIELPMKKYDL